MCKVSVIVPVYNTEKYLRACLNSLAAQTLKDFEVIIVNDGSTDDSLSIAEEFAAYHSNFKLFSIENNGVSHARNYGAEMSHGDYLAFVDSDDEVEPDYCKAMYEKAVRDGNDVVICWHEWILRTFDGALQKKPMINTFREKDNFRLEDYPSFVLAVNDGPWNKLVKRELFSLVHFSEQIRYGEDHQFSVKVCCLAEQIGTVKQILYHYFRIHGDATARISPKWLDVVLNMEQLLNFLRQKRFEERFYSEVEQFCFLHMTADYNRLVEKDDNTWKLRLLFLGKTQACLRKNFPHWRKNHYYIEKKYAMPGKDARFYRRWHLQLLIIMSRFLPAAVYRQILRVDRKVMRAGRRLSRKLYPFTTNCKKCRDRKM